MIVEKGGKYPHPLSKEERKLIEGIVLVSRVPGSYDGFGNFNNLGEFVLASETSDDLYGMWSASVVGHSFRSNQLRRQGRKIEVWGCNRNLLNSISPLGLRFADHWSSGEVEISRGDFVLPPGIGKHADKLKRCSVKDIFDLAAQGENCEFSSLAVPLVNVTSVSFTRERKSVYWLQLKPILPNNQRGDVILLDRFTDDRACLVERDIIYPFLTTEQYLRLCEGTDPGSYNSIDPEKVLKYYHTVVNYYVKL